MKALSVGALQVDALITQVRAELARISQRLAQLSPGQLGAPSQEGKATRAELAYDAALELVDLVPPSPIPTPTSTSVPIPTPEPNPGQPGGWATITGKFPAFEQLTQAGVNWADVLTVLGQDLLAVPTESRLSAAQEILQRLRRDLR